MRPTEQRISTGLVQQESSIKPVGVQVAARPVALAVDDTQSKQLAILQQQLNAFTGGASQVADVMQEEYVQGEQTKALQDYTQDPTKTPDQIAAGDQSSYYKTARMRLFGDSAGIDLVTEVDAEAKRLLEQKDELKGLDVTQHINEFIQKRYAGLQDPDALKALVPHAEKARASYTAQLKQAKLEALKEDERQAVWENTYKRFSAPDAAPDSVLGNWQETVAAVGEDNALLFNMTMVESKIQGAATSEEAAHWLKVADKQLPGTSVTMRAIGGPKLQEKLDRLRNYVGTLAANEEAARITAMNEERAAQEKAQKDAWSTNKSIWELNLSKTTSPEDVGRASAYLEHAIKNGLVDPSEGPLMVLKLAVRQQEVAAETGFEATRRAKNGEQLPADAGEKAAMNFANEFLSNTTKLSGTELNKWYSQTLGYMARSAPGQVSSLNKQVFSGASNSAIEVVSGGANVAVPSRLLGQVDAFKAARDMGFSSLEGIPDKDHIFLGQILQGVERGMNPRDAVVTAYKNVTGNRAPLTAATREEAVKKLLDKPEVTDGAYVDLGFTTLRKPFFNKGVSEGGKAALTDYARYALSTMVMPAGSTAEDAAGLVAQDIKRNFMLVSESGVSKADSGLIYLGANFKDEKGNLVSPIAVQSRLKTGLQSFIDVQAAAGKKVDFYPVDRNGNHEVVLTEKDGSTRSIIVPLSDFLKLGDATLKQKAERTLKAQSSGLIDNAINAVKDPGSLVGLSKQEIEVIKRSEIAKKLELARGKAFEGVTPIGAGKGGKSGPVASPTVDASKYQGINFGFVPVPQLAAAPKVSPAEKRVAVQGAKRNLGLELPPPPPGNLPPEPPPIPKPKK